MQGLDSKFKHFLILNDSIFALRQFTGIAESLRSNNHKVVSLNYNKIKDENKIWIESVFRGFNADGLSVFMNHSCVPASHPKNCKEVVGHKRKKKCIVQNFEVGLAWEFPPMLLNRTDNEISGLYDGMVPDYMYHPNPRVFTFPTWANNVPYWEFLVKEKGFPAAKVNNFYHVNSTDDIALQNCTKYLNRTYLKEFNYDSAVRVILY